MNSEEALKFAQESLLAGDLRAAADHCAAILEADGQHRDALHILALVRQRAGQPAEALALMERAIAAAPEFVPALNDYAAMQLGSNNPRPAIEALDKALQLEPGFADARINLGNALHSVGRLAEAEEQYQQGISLNPGHARGWTSLGNLLTGTRRAEDAVTCFQTALQHAPGDAAVHNFLGMAYRELGRVDEAHAAFKHALELNPALPEANASVGSALMGEGRFKEALPFLEKSGSQISVANGLRCLLELKAYDEFFNRIDQLAGQHRRNLHVASISAYAAQQFDRADNYPFCPNPLEYVRVIEEPGGSKPAADFLDQLINDATMRESVWEPRGVSTKKGFQTAATLFEAPTPALARLEALIRSEIQIYRASLRTQDIPFITDWPAHFSLNAWFVRLLKQGQQETHNHPEGWLSGVIYLRVPTDVAAPEGAIEFSLKSNNYPVISEETPRVLHTPQAGQLVLFPSSLFHRTVPFSSAEERLCIAFDMEPLA